MLAQLLPLEGAAQLGRDLSCQSTPSATFELFVSKSVVYGAIPMLLPSLAAW